MIVNIYRHSPDDRWVFAYSVEGMTMGEAVDWLARTVESTGYYRLVMLNEHGLPVESAAITWGTDD